MRARQQNDMLLRACGGRHLVSHSYFVHDNHLELKLHGVVYLALTAQGNQRLCQWVLLP